MRFPRAARFPVWAYVAHFTDHPGGPAFRGRCAECPVDLPIRQAAGHLLDEAALEAALHEAGPVADAARAAYYDLAQHLLRRHGIRVGPPLPGQLRFELRRPPA